MAVCLLLSDAAWTEMEHRPAFSQLCATCVTLPALSNSSDVVTQGQQWHDLVRTPLPGVPEALVDQDEGTQTGGAGNRASGSPT